MRRNSRLLQSVEEIKLVIGSERMPLIYQGEDELLKREQSFGVNEKPADYLLSFHECIKNNISQSAALAVVINKPKDLAWSAWANSWCTRSLSTGGFVNNTFAQEDGAKPVEKLLGKVKIQWHFVTNPPNKCQFIL